MLNFLPKYSARNSSVELIRIFAMMGIVLIHTLGHGSGLDYNWIYSLGNQWNTTIHLMLFSLGKACVTIFMFISGYYGITFKVKKLIMMVAMLMFYIVVIAIVSDAGWKSTLMNVTLRPWEGWWFVSCYIVIYILSPIINAGIKYLSEKQFRITVILLIIYTYYSHTNANNHDAVILLTIFMTGQYLKMYPPPLKYGIICAVSAALLMIVPVLIIRLTQSKTIMYLFLNNNNVLLLIFASSLVIFFEKKEFHSTIINWLSSSTLAIYLITDSNGLRQNICKWLLDHLMANAFIGYLLIVSVCIGCLLIDKIRELLFILFDKIVGIIKIKDV